MVALPPSWTPTWEGQTKRGEEGGIILYRTA